MKKLNLSFAIVAMMLVGLGSTAHATPLLTFNYTFSFVLNTASKSVGNDNNPTVTGELTLTQVSASSTTFNPTSLTLNAFTLPIDANAADNLSVPSFTLTGSILNGSVYTLSTPSNGIITTQGSAATSAGDHLTDSSGNSYLFGLAKASGASDVAYTLSGSTGGTYFATGNVVYTAASVPEPSAWALAFLGATGFWFLRRRATRA